MENLIIFLDFDGVLQIEKYDNPWIGAAKLLDGYKDRDQYGLLFDFECTQRLQQLIDATDAVIVISSSWRYSGLKKMLEMWKERKMPGKILDIISIEDSSDGLSRGENIQKWLETQPCDSYVIIDDVNDFLETQQEYFVETNYLLGIQDDDLKKAIEILKR